MKRVGVMVLVGSAVAVAGLASGSAVGVSTGFGGASVAGDGTSAAMCERDGVGTALGTGFDPALGYTVTAVAVDGIDAHCGGHRLSVAVTDAAGAVVAQGGPLAVPAGGGTLTVPVPPMAVATVARVHILLD